MNPAAGDTLPDALAPTQPLPRRSRPLRWRLLVLAAGGLLPLALAALGALLYVMQERSRVVQETALGTARSVAAAVQADIDSTIAVLETLGGAEALLEGRLQPFEARARRLAESRGWRTITLADGTGRLLFSTTVPGTGSVPAVDPASLLQAIERRAPLVGRLVAGPRGRGPAFAVRVPVVRDGQVRYVLSAILGGEQVLALVQRQHLAGGAVVAVFDAAGARVARSVENSERRASPTLQALIDSHPREGSGTTRTLEGVEAYTGFHRLRDTGWVVAVGIPTREVHAALRTSLLASVLGLLASLALSGWLAWFFARRVSRPIDQLKQAAAALGRGEPLAPRRLDIEELDEVGQALVRASRERERAAQERLAAEAERERLLARATEALQRAEEAARSKDEFLAVLGHELRNPLAPIASALQLMAIKGDDATRAERRIVERQLAHMRRLVDDLLDVSRITSRKLEIRRESMRVGPWVEQVVDAVRGSVGRRRLQVELPSDAAQSWVEGDPVRLAQVLANLLGNAIKFTADEGGITVSARREDGHIALEVRDDGLGMAPEEAERAFELFWQAPQARQHAGAGLGLGLPIVRSLVEMHGGRVEAESAGPGRGSRFVVRLPLAAHPGEATVVPTGTPAPLAEGGGARVLVVDDNHDAADTCGALLESCGFQVRVTYTPEDALAALADFRAEVGLLDIGLPGMDGYQLARAIRARPQGAAVRLVAITGYGQESDVARARAHGFDAHMTKPVDVHALLALVEKLSR
ncbi:MAG TPA: ATP-binding protein [Ramlibacter sp.]|nr:ATP-binding protein [Ramlibacter sp.]